MRFGLASLVLLGAHGIANVAAWDIDFKPPPEEVFAAFTKAGYRDANCTLENVSIRREWRHLPAAMRKDYISAVRCLMKKPGKTPLSLAPGVRSRFDDFQATHINQTLHIHGTADFLVWHRWFLFEYEKNLRECGYEGVTPYWDWTLDTNLTTSPIFDGTPTSMGSNGVYDPSIPPITTLIPSTGDPPFSFPSGSGGGCVAEGPFSDITVSMGPKFNLSYNPRCLKRSLSQWGLEHWCNRTDLLDLYTYDDIGMFQFIMQGDEAQQQLGVHGGGHRMTGGDMQDVFASPGDPVFYLHHGMVDRVWWLWQLQDPAKRTLPINGTSTLANNPPSPPMKLTDYINLGYVLPGEQRQLQTMMSTLAGGFCYVYL